jgi:hypothetical protein
MRAYLPIVLLPFLAGALAACSSAKGSVPSDLPVEASPPMNPPGPQPSFGPLIQQKEPPPPISGGTLAMAPDGTTAVAADSDRDRVYVVDLAARAIRHTVELPRRSEPGRVTVDDSGHAYVALRRSGAVATIDLATGAVTMRAACIAPRGIAFDKTQSAIHVACANGELVTLPRGAGEPTRQEIDRDARDVLVQRDGSLLVTTFRSASSLRLWKDRSPAVFRSQDNTNLAWRAVAAPTDLFDCGDPGCSDSTAVVVQEPSATQVSPEPGGYGGSSFGEGDCGAASGIVTTRLKLGRGSVRLPEAVLPVDLATNGRELAVVAAGNAFTKDLPQIFVVNTAQVRATFGGCVPTVHGNVPGQAVAAVFDGGDALVVQTREPAALHIMSEDRRRPLKTISLANDSVADTGHAIFHSNAGGFIACASCHAEGADDGHVWDFLKIGARRTPSLLGTVAGTEPFHWDGDMKDLRDIVDHVFVERMSGPKVDQGQFEALGGWLFALPEPTKLRTESADTARGAFLFNERCTACHSGGKLTNNKSFDVGTGGTFQIPSLIGVGWRQPLLHNGCAKTLTDRFDPSCGGGQHGDTADLNELDIANLVKFLETL